MAQDFAKQRQGGTKARRKPAAATREQAAPGNHWGWYFSGFFSGILAVGIGWLGVARLDELRNSPAEEPAGTSEIEIPTIAFDFYSALENTEVAVVSPTTPDEPSSETAAGTTMPAPVETVARTSTDIQPYLVQAGSFVDRQDAENLRAQLILLNLSASISQGVVNGRTVYRVQSGPYTGRAAAEEARQILTANGIESIFLRPR